MKAAANYGPGDIRVEDHAEHAPTPDNLIVKIRCCAICGTDLKLAIIGNPRCHSPRIIGHEVVGKVVHVGSQVKGFALGNRITLATTVTCGAGDAFVAGFLYGLLQDWDMRRCALFATATAAFCVRALGTTTAIPSAKTVLDFMEQEETIISAEG